jgi:hypothetical protein
MEPADLTLRDKSEPDPIEALLRQPRAPLPDNGFSRRVMSALPTPAATRQTASRRGVVITAATVAGLVLAIARIGSVSTLEHEWSSLESTFVQAASALNQTPTLVALAVAAASLLYTFFFATPRRR